MQRLDDWRAMASARDHDHFVATCVHPVMLLRWVVEGELGSAGSGQSTHVHNVRASLKDRLQAGDAVAARRPIGQERLIPVCQEPGSTHPFLFLLGRRSDSDVCINDYTVSSRHGRLHWLRRIGRWMIEDTKSTNGTWVNGKKLPVGERALLESTDEIQVGRLVFLFLLAGDLHRYLMGDY